MGVKCALYHANLSMKARKTAHRQFINDEIQVGASCMSSLHGPHSTVLTPWSSLHGPHSTVLNPWSSLHGPHSTVLTQWSSLNGPHSTVPNHRSSFHGPHSLVLNPQSSPVVLTHLPSVPGPQTPVLSPWSLIRGHHSSCPLLEGHIFHESPRMHLFPGPLPRLSSFLRNWELFGALKIFEQFG